MTDKRVYDPNSVQLVVGGKVIAYASSDAALALAAEGKAPHVKTWDEYADLVMRADVDDDQDG